MAFGKQKRGSKAAGPGSEAHRIFTKRRDSAGFPWSRVDRSLCVALLDCATSNGAAIMFGSVQGGRGISITIFDGDDKEREYASTEDEFAELAAAVIEALQGTSQDYFVAYGITDAEDVADD